MLKTLFLAAQLFMVHPRVIHEPTIRKSEGNLYTVENPKPYNVEITFNCGSDFAPVTAEMYPHTLETFELRTEDGRATGCWLDGWKKVP